MKTVARKFALAFPPLRRLYEFARHHADGHARCAQELQALQFRFAELEVRKNQVQGQLDAASKAHESAGLQLYVMRSDLQRAAVRNETLAILLAELETQVMRNSKAEELCRKILEHRSLQADDTASRADLNLLYSRIGGQLTTLSSEISRLSSTPAAGGVSDADLYLDLLESALTGLLCGDATLNPLTLKADSEVRVIEGGRATVAGSIVTLEELRCLRVLADRVIVEGIPGDMLDAGGWRRGACIYLRGVLAARDIRDRRIWALDLFEALPSPDSEGSGDANGSDRKVNGTAVTLEQAQARFHRYGLFDSQVNFLEGFGRDILPSALIEQLSLLCLGGETYSLTLESLEALYPRVAAGGCVLLTGFAEEGRKALREYRLREGIEDELHEVDGAAVYWRKGH